MREVFEQPRSKQDHTIRRHRTINKDHGRIEERRSWVAPAPAWVGGAREWPKLTSVVKLQARRTIDQNPMRETRYSLSSLPPDDPVRIAGAIRSHWFIENALHWTLDVTFSEDHSRVRTGYAAENLALVRRLAVSLLKNEKTAKTGIATGEYKIRPYETWNDDYLLHVLSTCT